MTCEHCGSTFFEERRVNQFANSGYGSAEFEILNPSSRSIYVCICGHPASMQPKLAVGAPKVRQQMDEFYTSLSKAREYREKNDSRAILHEVSQGTVSRDEVNQILVSIEEKLSNLAPTAGPTDEPVPEEPVRTAKKAASKKAHEPAA